MRILLSRILGHLMGPSDEQLRHLAKASFQRHFPTIPYPEDKIRIGRW